MLPSRKSEAKGPSSWEGTRFDRKADRREGKGGGGCRGFVVWRREVGRVTSDGYGFCFLRKMSGGVDNVRGGEKLSQCFGESECTSRPGSWKEEPASESQQDCPAARGRWDSAFITLKRKNNADKL